MEAVLIPEKTLIERIKAKINRTDKVKSWLHGTLVNRKRAQVRWYVKYFINPWLHKKAMGSIIRRSARLDLFPFNAFELGKDAVIESNCVITNGVGDVKINAGVRIGIGSVVMGPVEFGSNTILGQHVLVTGLDHNYTDPNQAIKKQGVSTNKTKIGEDSFIGANACILPGVSIGKHCVVGAGSVVTRDVPDYHIAAGNPAKLVKKYCFETKEWIRL